MFNTYLSLVAFDVVSFWRTLRMCIIARQYENMEKKYKFSVFQIQMKVKKETEYDEDAKGKRKIIEEKN